MIKEKEIIRVIELLSRWLAQIKAHNAISLYDINRFSEGSAARLLNAIYDYHLVDLNAEHRLTYPGIDLGDKRLGIAFK